MVVFREEIEFKAPPATSPNAGRLILATVKSGSIKVDVNLDIHEVRLSVVPEGEDRELLIRIAIGITVFKVRVKGGFFLYYETSDGYNVIPILVPKGKDPEQPLLQAVALLASPVPPRDASQATEKLSIKELTLHELNVRRSQVGLPRL